MYALFFSGPLIGKPGRAADSIWNELGLHHVHLRRIRRPDNLGAPSVETRCRATHDDVIPRRLEDCNSEIPLINHAACYPTRPA